MCLVNFPSAYGLATKTTNIIHGYAPEVIDTKLASDKHGFTLNGVFYSESTGNIKEGEINEFDGNLTFNDFVIKLFDYQSLDNQKNYQDVDGDKIDPIQPFLMTTTTWQWFDANGVKIPDGEKDKIIGCGSGYPMPLRLEISNQVQTISQYGIPRKSDFVTIKKVYKIAAKPELCSAKPNDIVLSPRTQWRTYDATITSPVSGPWEWNGSNTIPNSKHGGGYTNDFIPNMGFKINPTVSTARFPTTGFPGAKFQLLMSGAQQDYSYSISVNPGNNVSIDSMGFVTLKGKPTGDGKVTIRATLIRNTAVKFDYSFNPTTIWLEPQKNSAVNFSSAQNICGSVDNLPLRKHFTNSPANSEGPNWNIYANSFSRAIGGGIMGEWGWLANNYPNSNWESVNSYNVFYWTQEVNAYNVYFTVNYSGYVVYEEASKYLYTACKR